MAEKRKEAGENEGYLDRGDGQDTSPTAVKRKHTEVDDQTAPIKKKFGFTMGVGKKDSDADKPKVAPQSIQSLSAPKPPAIKMSLGAKKPKEAAPVTAVKKSFAVASVFNQDDDSDEEEMPAEARMRMRNIGRKTPTAAGPNSFGKSNLGFCDRQKIIARELQKQMDEIGDK